MAIAIAFEVGFSMCRQSLSLLWRVSFFPDLAVEEPVLNTCHTSSRSESGIKRIPPVYDIYGISHDFCPE